MENHVKCLDKGFVRLVDMMGSDLSIVRAARVSFGEGSKGPEADRRLINYLMRMGHTSPFEMVTLQWHVKCPIFVSRQWMRHRTWAYNEISQRYTEITDEFYIPAVEDVNYQSSSNKQGRGEQMSIADAQLLTSKMVGISMDCFNAYQSLLAEGMAKELARVILPLGTYTEFYGTVSLHNLFHFIKLRSDPHAQKEIRVYSDSMLNILWNVVPWSTSAFLKYQLGIDEDQQKAGEL